MITGNVAVLLNLLSIAVLAFAICICIVTISTRLFLPNLESLTFNIRKIALWSIVSSPWWVAGVCVSLFWPGERAALSLTWLSEFAHWHHIDIFSYSSWHSIALLVAGLFLSWTVFKAVYVRHKQVQVMSDLLQLSNVTAAKTSNNHAYFLLPLSTPAAFTSGFVEPKVYLTSGLTEKITEQELDIVVQHELAHVEAKDPLFKVVYSVFASFYPVIVKFALIKQYILVTEQMADNAVTETYDHLDVAQTLINVARMQRSVSLGCDGLQTSYFGNDQTSIRVERLVYPLNASSKVVLILTILLFASIPVLTASTVDSIHHIIETFFSH
ncbi:M56 family metallopeptidase [Pseudoalteromonas xiamenensis]|uniref:M56 family metallopeptidase n=1 Tax=Pseudoalteromonas xiamenensis TaxID=882626 RepID=UPI0035E6FDF3